jgi:hypothetical protein
MASNTKKTVAVGGRTSFVVMLAQAGSPSRARPETVGVFQTAMTPHTGNEIDTILSRTGAAEVYLPLKCSSTAMAVVTAGADIRVIQVGGVETGPPVKILRRRYVGAALPETGVTLGALSDRTDRVRVELVRSGVAGPERYGARGHHRDHGSTERRNAT